MSDFKDFIELVFSIKDRKVLEDFLLGITTPQERSAFIQRVEIVNRLIEGQPQHKIAKSLGVGVATVTRGSKELHQGRFKALRK